jgi:hypothetical protein
MSDVGIIIFGIVLAVIGWLVERHFQGIISTIGRIVWIVGVLIFIIGIILLAYHLIVGALVILPSTLPTILA